MKRIDLVGQTFGWWSVLSYQTGKHYLCRCKCGKEKRVQTGNLTSGGSRSCRQCSSGVEVVNKLPSGEAAFNDLFGRYRASAKKRGFVFDIDKPLFRLFVTLPCNYCGQPPKSIWPTDSKNELNGSFTYSGLDRVDSSVGYISTNIAPCCKICNYMKQSLSESEFLTHIQQILDFDWKRYNLI